MFTPALLLLATGCEGYPPVISGTPVWRMFPFDGERSWDYLSTDLAATYKLNTTSVGEAETIDGTRVYTLSTVKECIGSDPDCVDGDLVHRLSWSSDASSGVQVWGYAVGNDPYVEMRPPVKVAHTEMLRDESVETTTGGVVWTSTMNGIQECPIKMVATWDECAVFEIGVDGGPPVPLSGIWYATAGNGVAAFEREGEEGRWELSDIDCEGECDGSW